MKKTVYLCTAEIDVGIHLICHLSWTSGAFWKLNTDQNSIRIEQSWIICFNRCRLGKNSTKIRHWGFPSNGMEYLGEEGVGIHMSKQSPRKCQKCGSCYEGPYSVHSYKDWVYCKSLKHRPGRPGDMLQIRRSQVMHCGSKTTTTTKKQTPVSVLGRNNLLSSPILTKSLCADAVNGECTISCLAVDCPEASLTRKFLFLNP